MAIAENPGPIQGNRHRFFDCYNYSYNLAKTLFMSKVKKKKSPGAARAYASPRKKNAKRAARKTRHSPDRADNRVDILREADLLLEPKTSYNSRIRQIGNSNGVILSNQVIQAAGLNQNADVVIKAAKGIIYIIEIKASGVNTDLSTWDKQFKATKAKGIKPEKDLFEGMENEFDSKEW
jgi:antitoxin component of MazEF toxin-antitoxin module